MRKILFHLTERLWLAAFLTVLGCGPMQAQVAKDSQENRLSGFAKRMSQQMFPQGHCDRLVGSKRTVVGIEPFKENRIPITSAAARTLYSELLAGLIASKSVCVDYIDGAGIAALMENKAHLGAITDSKATEKKISSDLDKTLDVWVELSLTQLNNQALLSAKAVDRRSRLTLAQESGFAIPAIYLNAAATEDAMALEAAVDRAIAYFSDNADEMTVLRPRGIYFQDSGVQPEFGRYLTQRLTNKLVTKFTSFVTPKKLRVRPYRNLYARRRGMRVDRREIDPLQAQSQASSKDQVYELVGNYWVSDHVIEVNLSLRKSDNTTISWNGKIRRGSHSEKKLLPTNPALSAGEVKMPPSILKITTKRGENPVYRPGEEFVALVHLTQPSWLYCFFIDANGKVQQLLPNSLQADGREGRYFDANTLYAVPDGEKKPADPYVFSVTGSSFGEEIFKCFSSTRDIIRDLPPELRGSSFDALPIRIATRLRQIFHALPDTKIGEASLTLTVR